MLLLMENMQDLERVINIPVYYYELFQGYRGKMESCVLPTNRCNENNAVAYNIGKSKICQSACIEKASL